MKALAISGSPRAGGNTDSFLHKMLGDLESKGVDTEFVALRDLRIQPCKGCYGCLEKKRCVQDDDFEGLYARMLSTDAILVGSPVYVSRPSALLSALLERVTFTGRATGRLLSGKVGAPFTVARRAGVSFAFAELLLWYYINDMVIPGSMYWNVGIAGAKGAKDAERDLEGMEIAKYTAANVFKLMKALQGAGMSEAIARDKLFFTKSEEEDKV
jgi:multimeric flavodoxin WrbA